MRQHQSSPSIVAVVVAYNRAALLTEAINALLAQDTSLTRIVVVDNASTDETTDVVRRHSDTVTLVSLNRNTGGAGGFTVGLATALAEHSPDWIWLMDDDTIPTPSALTELLAAVDGTDVVVAGSRVVWTDGSDHPMNTPRRKPFVGRAERVAASERGNMAVRSSSFVSLMVRSDRVRSTGLPVADYFIWNDDFEYSTRLLRRHRGVFVPASVVVHKTRLLGSTDADPGPRFYHEVRNKIWMLSRSKGLNGGEKLLYGASTIRRWFRTFAKSSDRATLRDGFTRGLRDGLRTRPRANVEALEGLGGATRAVIAVEGHRG